jgi:hypothetical protein
MEKEVILIEDTHEYIHKPTKEKLESVSNYIRKKYLVLLPEISRINSIVGNNIHKQIEDFFKYNLDKTDLSSFNKFIKFNIHLKKDFIVEEIVYDLNKKLAGKIDYYNTKRQFLIDWKSTSKTQNDIVEKYKELIENFNDQNYEGINHYLFSYLLQQNLYKLLLKRTFDYNVKKMFLVFLSKFNDEYTIIDLNKVMKKLQTNNIFKDILNMKKEWEEKNSLKNFL